MATDTPNTVERTHKIGLFIAVLNVILAVIAAAEILVGCGAVLNGAYLAAAVAFVAAAMMIACIGS